MAKVESSVVINRPVAEVFAFVTDPEANMTKWNEAAESITKTSEGPPALGSTFEVRGRMGPRQFEFSQRVTAFELNRRVELEATGKPIAPNASWTFDEEDGGTRVTFRGDPNPVGLLKLLSPIVTRQSQRLWDGNLARLKRVMESSAG